MNKEEIIRRLKKISGHAVHVVGESPFIMSLDDGIALNEAVQLLKEQEAREPHYTTLRYIVNGMEMAVRHPECPRCIEKGLVLWDAEIEKGQTFCKRCGQAVKWECVN